MTSLLTPTLPRIQTAGIFFAGWQGVWLLCLATLWILAVTTSNSVALMWSLWRIPDLLMMFVNLGVATIYQVGKSTRPALFVAVIAGATLCSDIAALCTFAVQYASCLDDIKAGNTLTDPLCMTADLKKVGIYHLIILAVLTLGAILNIYIPIMMFRISEKGSGGQSLWSSLGPGAAGTSNNRSLRHLCMIGRLLSILIGCGALLAVEVSVLTEASDIKYLWFCHALMVVPAVLTAFPTFLEKDSHNKIGTIVSVAAFVGSALGLGLMSWYYDSLCAHEPPKTNFSNFKTCELGKTGAIYFVTLHSFFTLISLIRVLVYLFILRISASIHYSSNETRMFMNNQTMDTQAESKYGRSYSQYGFVELISNLSGAKLKV